MFKMYAIIADTFDKSKEIWDKEQFTVRLAILGSLSNIQLLPASLKFPNNFSLEFQDKINFLKVNFTPGI